MGPHSFSKKKVHRRDYAGEITEDLLKMSKAVASQDPGWPGQLSQTEQSNTRSALTLSKCADVTRSQGPTEGPGQQLWAKIKIRVLVWGPRKQLTSFKNSLYLSDSIGNKPVHKKTEAMIPLI